MEDIQVLLAETLLDAPQKGFPIGEICRRIPAYPKEVIFDELQRMKQKGVVARIYGAGYSGYVLSIRHKVKSYWQGLIDNDWKGISAEEAIIAIAEGRIVRRSDNMGGHDYPMEF